MCKAHQKAGGMLKMQNHHQNLKTNRILAYIKVTVLLHHTYYLDWLLHGFGQILAVIHLWIIVECICDHISFNILINIQIMEHHKDRLLLTIIWSKSVLTNDEGSEKTKTQDIKCLQPRWCPSGLSHTQKRRLQRMRKKESVEQQAEVVPVRSATIKKVWRPKQVVSPSAWIKASHGW